MGAALREAGRRPVSKPSGVDVLHCLPDVFTPPSGFVVTPVLGWWRKPTPVSAMDPAEVSDVHRVPIAELTDPGNRVNVRHPSGYIGPGSPCTTCWSGDSPPTCWTASSRSVVGSAWDPGRIVDIGWT